MADFSSPNTQSTSSSVPVAFFGPWRLSEIKNSALGKRKRNQKGRQIFLYEPDRDLPPRKRRRLSPPSDCNCNWHFYPRTPLIGPPTPQPWHRNDRFLRQLPQSELNALVEPPFPSVLSNPYHHPTHTNLTNPIHPLLRPLLNLATHLPHLATSLRLATKFLIHPPTLPFFHTLITAPLSLLQEESHVFNTPVTWLPESRFASGGLPPQEYQLTMQTLVALTEHTEIQISPDPRLESRWAYTERHIPPQHLTSIVRNPRSSRPGRSSRRVQSSLAQLFPTPAYLHPLDPQEPSQDTAAAAAAPPNRGDENILRALNFRGTNARINISPLFLKMLHPHYTHTCSSPSSQTATATDTQAKAKCESNNRSEITPSQRERAAFFLAITLVHELAHAVFMTRFPILSPQSPNPNTTTTPSSPGKSNTTNAEAEGSLPPTDYEPFHALDRLAELGHAWETTVFHGGKILSLAQDESFGLGLAWSRWPGSDAFFVRDRCGVARAFSRATKAGDGRDGGMLGPPKWETVYPLDWRYIRRFFWEEFWSGRPLGVNGQGEGVRAFEVPKPLGSRLRNWDWVDRRCAAMGLEVGGGSGSSVRGGGGIGGADADADADETWDDGWSSGCSSRGRGHDASGVVREGQIWLPEEDEDEFEDDEDEDE